MDPKNAFWSDRKYMQKDLWSPNLVLSRLLRLYELADLLMCTYIKIHLVCANIRKLIGTRTFELRNHSYTILRHTTCPWVEKHNLQKQKIRSSVRSWTGSTFPAHEEEMPNEYEKGRWSSSWEPLCRCSCTLAGRTRRFSAARAPRTTHAFP